MNNWGFNSSYILIVRQYIAESAQSALKQTSDCPCFKTCVAVSPQGEVVHWLACSLYAACRKGSTPTVGKGLMEGNCVSLTRILRYSKLR